MEKEKQTAWVDISNIVEQYLPISKRKARKFIDMYCSSKKIVGGRIYVERKQLEQLLADPDRERFPLDF